MSRRPHLRPNSQATTHTMSIYQPDLAEKQVEKERFSKMQFHTHAEIAFFSTPGGGSSLVLSYFFWGSSSLS